MRLLYGLAGLLLLVVSVFDALWTTLWVDGHGGPITRGHTSLTRRAFWLAARPRHHRLLSLTGPVVLMSSVVVWAFLAWAGWVVLFSASPGSLVHSHQGTPATLVDRIYFTGYTMFTMGNGDFSPTAAGWKIATAAASVNGLFILTLSVTYLLSVLEAVVLKRSFASHVLALGETAEELVTHAWGGRGFPALELQIVSLTEQLNTVTEQHQAYPQLHFYHEARERQSVALGLAVFDEALTILDAGVAEECRPAPSAIRAARESVQLYLDTLGSAYISPSKVTPPLAELARLRATGIPTVGEPEFAAAVAALDERRRLLLGFLESEHREWPRAAGHV